MSPGALNGDSEIRIEDIVPAVVVVEIEGDSEERCEEIAPSVVTMEIGG